MTRLIGLILALGAIGCMAGQKVAVTALSPREYSLRVKIGTPPMAALALVQDSLLSALVQSQLLPGSFPQLGAVAVRPSSSEVDATAAACVELTGPSAAGGSPCIRLGARSYLPLSIVDFPDTRVHLFEVWPIDEGSALRRRDRLNTLPRIVIDLPVNSDDLKLDFTRHPNLYDVLERGLRTCGAKVLSVRD